MRLYAYSSRFSSPLYPPKLNDLFEEWLSGCVAPMIEKKSGKIANSCCLVRVICYQMSLCQLIILQGQGKCFAVLSLLTHLDNLFIILLYLGKDILLS